MLETRDLAAVAGWCAAVVLVIGSSCGCLPRSELVPWDAATVGCAAVRDFFRRSNGQPIEMLLIALDPAHQSATGVNLSTEEVESIVVALRKDTRPTPYDPGIGWHTSYGAHYRMLLYANTDAMLIWVDDFGFSLGGTRYRFINPSLAAVLRQVLESRGQLGGREGLYIRVLLEKGAGRLAPQIEHAEVNSEDDFKQLFRKQEELLRGDRKPAYRGELFK